jgi:hypothetical protein
MIDISLKTDLCHVYAHVYRCIAGMEGRWMHWGSERIALVISLIYSQKRLKMGTP